MKENVTNYLKINLQGIYISCTKKCLKPATFFNKGVNAETLSSKEKICLNKCFDRKSESF